MYEDLMQGVLIRREFMDKIFQDNRGVYNKAIADGARLGSCYREYRDSGNDKNSDEYMKFLSFGSQVLTYKFHFIMNYMGLSCFGSNFTVINLILVNGSFDMDFEGPMGKLMIKIYGELEERGLGNESLPIAAEFRRANLASEELTGVVASAELIEDMNLAPEELIGAVASEDF